jgi:hypothetical protein
MFRYRRYFVLQDNFNFKCFIYYTVLEKLIGADRLPSYKMNFL